MAVQRLSLLASTLVGIASVLPSSALAAGHGGGGGHGGGSGHPGYYHGGPYRGGPYHHGYGPYGHFYGPYHGYGIYRPYYGLGVGLGLGLGLGLYGAYAPYYGYGYPYYPYYAPPPVVAYAPPAYGTAGAPVAPAPGYAAQGNGSPQNVPPPDNAAHLQLKVPENAEVWFQGAHTTQTGTLREYTSGTLTPGQSYTYKISVRYTGVNGQPVNDTRDIQVRANDWFSIDFTQPAPPNAQTAPPNLSPPSQGP